MESKSADLIVIGAGPAGYVAAIRAAQLGMKVVCVDKTGFLGGTCLNEGCIPSKALLHSSHLYAQAQHDFKRHGIKVEKLSMDVKTMIANKDKVVLELNQGIDFLFKKNKITRLVGTASLKSATEVVVTSGKTDEVWTAKNILIATGSSVAQVPGITIDEKQVVSSTGALKLSKVPKSLIVVGGGYIGLEMGSVWSRLGSDVTVVEFADTIVPALDVDLRKQLHKTLEQQGLKFKLSTKVTEVTPQKGGHLEVMVEPAAGGKGERLKTDILLMSVGRRPLTQGLGLEKVGIVVNNHGFIPVNEKFQTSVPNIYAVGDVIPGPMLAHVAEEEGVAAVENMASKYGHVNYGAIPAVVYTHPEVATVGKTEDELKAAGVAYAVGKFPFMANSRGKAVGETSGFVKVIADKHTDRVLGVHIIGPDAGTLISEAVSVMEFGGSAEDIARTCHAHPTLNEALKEAAMAVGGWSIHM